MPSMERFLECGAVFAETLGDSIPELERKGFTVNGDPTCVDTPYGRGMSFSGISEALQYGVFSDLELNDSFTLSIRVKPVESKSAYIFGTWQGTGSALGRNINLHMDPDSGGVQFRGNVDDNVINTGVITQTFDINNWYHLVLVRDKGTSLKIYVNAVEEDSETDLTTGSVVSNQSWTIGARASDTSEEEFNGDCVNALIFPRALSAAEVSDLYNQTTFNYMDSLVSRWDMSEVNPQDLVGGNNGTGASITTSDIVVGQHGDAKAINFDGTNDYITIPNSTIDIQSDFSVFAWNRKEDGADNDRLFSFVDGTDSNNGFQLITDDSVQKWVVELVRDGVVVIDGATYNAISFDDWNMVGFSIKDTSGSFYYNGEETAAGATETILLGAVDGYNFGIRADLASSTQWIGDIGGVFIFNKHLTEIQARDLYEQTRQKSMSTSRINDPAYLKGYWPLNSNTDDVSGNGNDGIPTSLAYADGPFGRTVGDFDGSSTFIGLGSDFSFGTSDNKTITFWAKGEEDAPDNTGLVDQRGKGGLGTNIGLAIYQNSTNNIQAVFDDGSNATLLNGVGSLYNTIQFCAVVIDRTNGLGKIYINGVLDEAVDISSIGSLTNAKTLRLGARDSSGSAADFFDGNIWNITMYDVVLTGEEIQQIYQQEQRVPDLIAAQQPYSALPDITDSSLVGSFLNTATDGTAKDYSNNQNDGTNNNVFLGCNQGEFNGTNAYFDLGTNVVADADEGTWAATFSTDTVAGSLRSLFNIGSTGNNGLVAWSDSAGGFRVQYGNGSGTTTLDTTIETGRLYRVAICWKLATNSIKVYLDGVLIHSVTDATLTEIDTENQYLGWQTSTRYHDGIIKDFEAYSEQKDAAWVSQDYAKRVPDDSLLLWLKNGDKELSRYSTTVTNTDVVVGDKMYFPGTTSYIALGANRIDDQSPLTFVGWINPDSLGSATAGIISDQRFTFAISNTNDNLVARNTFTAGFASSATNSLELNRWIHVAITRDANDLLTFYVDGELSGDPNQDGGSRESDNLTVEIGRLGSFSYYQGQMDDIRVYKETKSADFIQQHYLQTRGAY